MRMVGQMKTFMKYFLAMLITATVTYVITVNTDGQKYYAKERKILELSDISTASPLKSHSKHKEAESQLIYEDCVQTIQHVIVKQAKDDYLEEKYHRNTSHVQKNITLKKQLYQFCNNSSHHHQLRQKGNYPTSPTEAPVTRRLPRKRSDWTSNQEFSRRKRRLDKVCDSTRIRGQVHGVYTHTSGVVYCYVPKAGCTFWKRVFTAAHYGYDKDIYRISRNTIHGLYGSGEEYTFDHNETAYPIRLLVVRDPFSRLLSSYLDKIYLPDFWPSEAKSILRDRTTCSSDFMRSHFDQVASLFEGRSDGYTSCGETWCAKYLTFSEFIRGGLSHPEPHWMPIHQICNPCVFNASHVAYMESFNQDTRPILRHMGLINILNSLDHNQQVDKEIEMLIDYHFNRSHESELVSFYSSCISPRELAFRLWQTFQWKGYIDPGSTYSIPDYSYTESFVKEDLLHQVRKARASGLLKPEAMKEAHEFFKEKAYRSVPKYMFENLMVKFKTDFDLFGYERTRNILYSSLYNGDYDTKYGTKVQQ